MAADTCWGFEMTMEYLKSYEKLNCVKWIYFIDYRLEQKRDAHKMCIVFTDIGRIQNCIEAAVIMLASEKRDYSENQKDLRTTMSHT